MTPGNFTMLKLPFLTATPPMATKIFLLASMSRELRCQCPMVTPCALGGKACAQAFPAASVNISDNAAISLVMADLFVEPTLSDERRAARTLPLRQGARKPMAILPSRPASATRGGEARGE